LATTPKRSNTTRAVQERINLLPSLSLATTPKRSNTTRAVQERTHLMQQNNPVNAASVRDYVNINREMAHYPEHLRRNIEEVLCDYPTHLRRNIEDVLSDTVR
jgi:hypothetical protein